MTHSGETLTLGSNEVKRKQKKKGEKRKHTFCSYSERDLKEKLEDMDTNIENKKKRKQSLDENLKVSNAVILALEAPVNANIGPTLQTFAKVNANIESALQMSETNTEGSACWKKKRKKKNHKTVENNSLAEKLPKVGKLGEQDLKQLEDMEINIEIDKKSKQSLDENLEVSITDDLSVNAPVNGTIEMAMQLQTTVKNIEGSSTQKKKMKKKKHKAVENDSPVQKLLQVGSLGEYNIEGGSTQKKKMKKKKHKAVENNSPVQKVLEVGILGEYNIEMGSTQKKKMKKKKHKAVENNSPVQKVLEVGSLGEQVLKELEDMEIKTEKKNNRKQSVDENFEVSNSDDPALKIRVNGNIETCLQTAGNNIEEGPSQEKTRKKKKHKAVENNSPVQKLLEVGSLGEQDKKELEDMKIYKVKEKRRKKSVDDNLEVSDVDYLSLKSLVNQSMETAENNTEGSSGRQKKRKKKKHKVVENNSPEQRLLEDGNMFKQDVRELEDVETNTKKEKKRRHVLIKNMEISNADDLSLKPLEEKSTGGGSSWKKKRKEKKCKAVENSSSAKKLLEGVNRCVQDRKELEDVEINMDKEWKIKESLDENKVISKIDDLAMKSSIRNIEMDMQTTENTAEGSSRQKNKKRTKKKNKIVEINEPVQELLESGNLCDQDLKNKKHLEKVSHEVSMGDTVVLEVLESVDTDLKKNDKLTETSLINNGREKRRKRKKKRLSCSSASTTQPAYVMQTAQNSSVGEISVSSDKLVSSKSELGNNRKNRENGDELNEARKLVGEHGISEERNLEELPNMLHGCSESKLGMDKLAGPANLLMVVENSPSKDVSINFSDCTLASEGNEGSIHMKKVNGTVNGSGVLKVEDRSMLKTTGENFVTENEDELNKIQRTVHDDEFSGKPSVEEFLTYCDKEEKSSLETGDDTDCVAHILLHLRHGKNNSSESCEGGLKTQLQSVKNISIGESPANCGYKSPAPGKGVKKKKKLYHGLHDSPCNPFLKQLEQKNEEIKSESIQLDEATARCHVLSGGNLEVSITELKREERISSSNVSVMKDDILVGDISKEDNHLQKLPPLPERSPCSTRKKLLVLDLNGILADIVSVAPKGFKVDKKIAKKSLFKRAHCDEFLKFCFERFDVGVWSSRYKKNVDSVVDFLMKDLKHKLLFCWDQSHCTDTGFKTIENKHKPFVLKELKKLWDKHDPNLPWEKGEYNESNSLLVDDSPYKALCNPPNTAIFPYPYRFQDIADNSLGTGGDLRVYLEELSMAEDVQNYVKEHPFGQCAITSKNPSWSFYSEVLGAKIAGVQL